MCALVSLKHKAIRAALSTLYVTGAHRAVRPLVGGVGAILAFHRVRPDSDEAFQPNRALAVSPQFLETAIERLRRSDLDIVSLDEAVRRLTSTAIERRFAVLTFDDGYRDVLEHAVPILRRNHTPYTIYIASAFADGSAFLWWEVLEAAISANTTLEITLDVPMEFDCSTAQAKLTTYRAIRDWLGSLEHEEALRSVVDHLAQRYGIDGAEQCRKLCMNWRELATLAKDPLATIGSHTVSHPFLAKLGSTDAEAELVDSRTLIGEILGAKPLHLAYPIGDPGAAGQREFMLAAKAGYQTAVTLRRGVLFAEHDSHLTALPRIPVSGDFQNARLLEVLLSGLPTAFANGFRRVDAA